MSLDPEFEDLVNLHYSRLFQFALSLTQNESDAADLTQQTFLVWANKNHQLQDRSKAKTWLFTTLHRDFITTRRRLLRFQPVALEEVDEELPPMPEPPDRPLDAHLVLEALGQLDALFRAPVALFYLEDHSYKDIAEILGIPIGTVKSRLSRGITQLQQLLAANPDHPVDERGDHD
jgi:RNA polymerase sigma factor (sigma-70 family)